MTTKLAAEFLIQQYYRVILDEDRIDEERKSSSGKPEWIEKQFARMHRMLQAIVANKKALFAVVEYRVISEHSSHSGERQEFFESHYGKPEMSLAEVLLEVADCFTEEDRDWLASLKSYHGDVVDLDPLENAFEVEDSGWNLEPVPRQVGR